MESIYYYSFIIKREVNKTGFNWPALLLNPLSFVILETRKTAKDLETGKRLFFQWNTRASGNGSTEV